VIENFLSNEWRIGAMFGDKPEKAFVARGDRSTIIRNDLDQGRLICVVGVAPRKPAEFVIFRIGNGRLILPTEIPNLSPTRSVQLAT